MNSRKNLKSLKNHKNNVKRFNNKCGKRKNNRNIQKD